MTKMCLKAASNVVQCKGFEIVEKFINRLLGAGDEPQAFTVMSFEAETTGGRGEGALIFSQHIHTKVRFFILKMESQVGGKKQM